MSKHFFSLALLISSIILGSLFWQIQPPIEQPQKATSQPPSAKNEEVRGKVLPKEAKTGVIFGKVIVDMVRLGVIDKSELLALFAIRRELNAEEKKLFETPAYDEIVLTSDNAGLLLNLLWPLGLANKTNVLSAGPMGTTYKKEVANFASTGGWTLGKKSGEQYFNRFSLISLTKTQEQQVKEIAQSIYRPCCGNSTYFPDCNHGAAMLGFIELAVAQGLSKETIYQKALALNSYWFPQTYVELAVYFQEKKNTSWEFVDPKEVLGENYSSSRGYLAINKVLQDEGLVPTVGGGSSCGV